jgi:hypothetical protein
MHRLRAGHSQSTIEDGVEAGNIDVKELRHGVSGVVGSIM